MLRPKQISELVGKTFVSKVYYFEEIDSTNNYAKRNNLPDGSLVITDNQTKGRGRFERVWFSEPGENLTFSISKRFDLVPEDQFILNCCVGNAVYNSIFKRTKGFRLKTSIKWPNDIIVNDKKIAGILIEKNSSEAKYSIGIGINVNQKKFNQEFLSQATSLSVETGKDYDINDLLLDVVFELDSNFELIRDCRNIEIFNSWKKNNKYIGKEVIFVDSKNDINSGKLAEILMTGQIVISDAGKRTMYSSGEITLKMQT